MLHDTAKGAVVRLPQLTQVPLAVCVSHPQRSGKGFPKPSWGWQAAPPSKAEQCPAAASLQLLQALLWTFVDSEGLFSLPERNLYTPVWGSIPCDCSHYIKPQTDPILPFQTSSARQTQTTFVLSTRLSFFLICPIAPHPTHTLLFIFFSRTWIFWGQREMCLILSGPGWWICLIWRMCKNSVHSQTSREN